MSPFKWKCVIVYEWGGNGTFSILRGLWGGSKCIPPLSGRAAAASLHFEDFLFVLPAPAQTHPRLVFLYQYHKLYLYFFIVFVLVMVCSAAEFSVCLSRRLLLLHRLLNSKCICICMSHFPIQWYNDGLFCSHTPLYVEDFFLFVWWSDDDDCIRPRKVEMVAVVDLCT